MDSLQSSSFFRTFYFNFSLQGSVCLTLPIKSDGPVGYERRIITATRGGEIRAQENTLVLS